MPRNKNTSLALNLAAIVVGMLMLAFASVPLYRLFCQTTGYNGTPRESIHGSAQMLNREITVSFNTDIDPALPWEFKPGEQTIKIKIGQQRLTHFVAKNLSDKPITGRAVYNILPLAAGSYFVKMQCFCFTNQTLAPGQKVDMPVLFYIDPSIVDDREMDDLKIITLSYTFFPVSK